LNETHRRLHDDVAAAAKRRQEGDKPGALELFNELDIEHLSHRIAALLIAADEHRMVTPDSSTATDTPSSSDNPAPST